MIHCNNPNLEASSTQWSYATFSSMCPCPPPLVSQRSWRTESQRGEGGEFWRNLFCSSTVIRVHPTIGWPSAACTNSAKPIFCGTMSRRGISIFSYLVSNEVTITLKSFCISWRWDGGGAAFLWLHHVHLKTGNKNKKQTLAEMLIWTSVLYSGYHLLFQVCDSAVCRLCDSLRYLSQKLFVSLPLKGQRRSNQNKKAKCNHFAPPTCAGVFPESFSSLPASEQLSLSSLLVILSALAETLFICGMFQTGGFERSTTFPVFCCPRLHLFWNVRQPLNSPWAAERTRTN